MCSTFSPGKCPLSWERKGGERKTLKLKDDYFWMAGKINIFINFSHFDEFYT